MSNYRDSELWNDARALVREAYRVTQSWPDTECRGLTEEVRGSARAIAKLIPGAIRKKAGPAGRPMWTYAMHSFTDLEVVCTLATDLEFTDSSSTKKLLELCEIIHSQVKTLAREAREVAKEQRSKAFGMDIFEDDDDE